MTAHSEGIGLIIDRVACVDRFTAERHIHINRLHKYNQQAVLKEGSIDKSSLESNGILHMSLCKIIEDLEVACRIAAEPQDLIRYDRHMDPDCVLSESSKKFYNDLSELTGQADLHLMMLRLYCHHYKISAPILKLESPGPDDLDDEYRFDFWIKEYGQLWWNEYFEPSEELDKIDAGFEPNRETDGDEEYVSWELEDLEKFADHALPNALDIISDFFTEKREILNYLYEHSVKLINRTAWEQIQIDSDRFGFDSSWTKVDPRSKEQGSENRFFNRKFQCKFFHVLEEYPDFGTVLEDGTLTVTNFWVRSTLIRAAKMVTSISDYIPILGKLQADKQSAVFTKDEVQKWLDWYAKRKEWHKALMLVGEWWHSYTNEPSTKDVIAAWNKLNELQDVVKIKLDDLELLKADQLIVQKRGIKKLPSTQAETMKKAMEALEPFQEAFDKPDLEVKIQRKPVAKYQPDEATTNSLAMLERYWLNKPRGIGIKNEFSELNKASRLEEEIRQYLGTKEYNDWYYALAGGEPTCNRHQIGMQRVTKVGAKDSAFRNAGMRFVELNNLDPVDKFDQVTLFKALRDQVNATGLNELKRNNIVRNLGLAERSDQLKPCFFDELINEGFDFDEVTTLYNVAQKKVGQKIVTKKTLYDTRQVAGLFAKEQAEGSSLRPKMPTKPKAPSNIEVEVSITGPEERPVYGKGKK